MLLPIPEDVLEAQARDRALDILLGRLGVSAAVASASFAAYMVVSGPTDRGMPIRAPIVALSGPPTHAPRRLAPLQGATPDIVAPAPGGIDFDPTGSILTAPAAAPDTPAQARAVLSDFAVRDAFDGTALVEAHGTLHMVEPGSVIEGAGTVLSVARRGNGWAVATTGGLIVQRR